MTTKRLIIRFHALLSVAGIRDQKQNILSGYGVESTKDLSIEQLQEVCDYLQGLAQKKNTTDPAVKKWRSVIIGTLEEMGIYKGKKSWPKVNEFLQQKRIAGKLLYECSIEEMENLNRKLIAIKKQWDKKIEEENYLGANN